MSLNGALSHLPGDRDTQQRVREILLALKRHVGEELACERLAESAGVPVAGTEKVLCELARGRVISFDEGSGRYLYKPDRLTAMDVDGFLRRVAVRTGMLQNNVERFRERYGK